MSERVKMIVEFLGRTWKITPTAQKTVLIIHHPQQHFWITAPAKFPAAWPAILGSYSLLSVPFEPAIFSPLKPSPTVSKNWLTVYKRSLISR
jgi:hypothetical protein